MLRISTKDPIGARRVNEAKDDDAFYIETIEDLAKLSSPQLVAVYNALSDRTIKKFEDKATACKRVWSMLQAIAPETVSGNGELSPEATAEEPSTSPQDEDMATKTKGKKSTTRKTGERKARAGADKKITVLADANPKREGTEAHARFKLYRDGMTIAQYVEKGGTRGDVLYDAAKKYIKLSDA